MTIIAWLIYVLLNVFDVDFRWYQFLLNSAPIDIDVIRYNDVNMDFLDILIIFKNKKCHIIKKKAIQHPSGELRFLNFITYRDLKGSKNNRGIKMAEVVLV